ncbi:hypothetical protein D8674_017751 [Pyrus ussuriensis x Pyrus communis]|uniref:Uncharacterized protein n=1 Tax=Pyrus ussuriensis x Pyrus communis TaxID=2448454 RepID=A0A5N5HIR6_9ROSA|nr:hypothetical protein D8674_017751 [Pyrus ussuriensis x Pyrus communis]
MAEMDVEVEIIARLAMGRKNAPGGVQKQTVVRGVLEGNSGGDTGRAFGEDGRANEQVALAFDLQTKAMLAHY